MWDPTSKHLIQVEFFFYGKGVNLNWLNFNIFLHVFFGRGKRKERKIDFFDSLTCPWNDPLSSVLNTVTYTDYWRQATIPVYQPSARLPMSCFNSDTSVVHISMDQISYQQGISGTADRTITFLPTSSNFAANDVQIVLGDIRGMIPNNQDYNITRLFYKNINDTVSSIPPPPNDKKNQDAYNAYLGSVSDSYNKGVNITTSASQKFSDPGTRLAVVTNGLPQDTALFPTATVIFNQSLWDNSGDNSVPVNDNNKYFQSFYGPVVQGIDCPSSILSKVVPGCTRFGCIFQSSATSPCYFNSATSFSSINGSNNIFFTSISGPVVTGCGVALSECYKVGGDPGFKPYCCRQSFTDELLDPSSLSLNPFPLNNSVSFNNTSPLQAFSYSAQTMYCDSSWTAGAPTCDVYLQDFCYNQVSTRDFGNGTKTIHSVLDSQHPCGKWYAGIMNEYASTLFTRRNIDIIDNIFVQYCATGGLASQVGDTQSCLCLNSFYGNGIYYTTPDGVGASRVAGASSKTDADILFTDPVCGSVMCNTDPQYFSFTLGDINSTISTVVVPSVVSLKRSCPKNICAVIVGNESISINNFAGGTEINIGDFTNSCKDSTGAVPRTVAANYVYSVQAMDDSPPLCGRWPYDTSSLQIIPDAQGGAAGFNLTFNVYNGLDPQIDIFYSVSGYNSPLFEFNSPKGTWTNVQTSVSEVLLLSVQPNGAPPPFDGQSSFVDSHPVTLLTSKTGDLIFTQKSFQVNILLFPNGPAPVVPQNIVPSKPLPQLPSTKLSRGSLALIALSLILLLYALGFFFEMIQIRNLITGASDILPNKLE